MFSRGLDSFIEMFSEVYSAATIRNDLIAMTEGYRSLFY
jgi:hypothetical protein